MDDGSIRVVNRVEKLNSMLAVICNSNNSFIPHSDIGGLMMVHY